MPERRPAADEFERLSALHELKILDTPPEERFERISRLGADILQAPIAYISLIDGERQWYKSICGIQVSETPRGPSLCSHTILYTQELRQRKSEMEKNNRDISG